MSLKYLQLAAEQGYFLVYHELAHDFYENGIIINGEIKFSENKQLALKYYEMAANMGYCHSIHTLATIYSNGCGVPVDKRIARSWFEKLAKYDGVQWEWVKSWLRYNPK